MEDGLGDVGLMLWAITSYFNPAGYKSRLANYRTFRKFLRAPLVTVEMSFTGGFELRPGNADVLVQLIGGDVLWQKERLLNIALRHLPRDCDAVAWLDCDIVFGCDDWARRALTALDDIPLIQLFHERCNLAHDATCDASGWAPIEGRAESVGSAVATGELKPDDLRISGASARCGAPTTGLAWVARRDLLERHGLYDARIIGGADRLIACAALGRFEWGVEAQHLISAKSVITVRGASPSSPTFADEWDVSTDAFFISGTATLPIGNTNAANGRLPNGASIHSPTSWSIPTAAGVGAHTSRSFINT